MEEHNDQLPTLAEMYEHLWSEIRCHRIGLLKAADIQVNLLEDNGSDASAWRSYRQLLRDLPGTTDNPAMVVWPVEPV